MYVQCFTFILLPHVFCFQINGNWFKVSCCLCTSCRRRSTTSPWTWRPSGSGVMCVSGRCFWIRSQLWFRCWLLPTNPKPPSRLLPEYFVSAWLIRLKKLDLYYVLMIFSGCSSPGSRSPTESSTDCCGRRRRLRIRGRWAQTQRYKMCIKLFCSFKW